MRRTNTNTYRLISCSRELTMTSTILLRSRRSRGALRLNCTIYFRFVSLVVCVLLAFPWPNISGANVTAETTVQTTTMNEETVATTASAATEPSSTASLCAHREKPYFLAHQSDSSQFYVCVKGHLFLLNCPTDYRFDEELDQCVRRTVDGEIIERKLL